MKRHAVLCLTALGVATVALWSCARQGFPEGGPKDVDPPVVVEETPANGTLHFDGKTFFVGFDEYVTLQDADNNVIVSPPMTPKPTFSTKRRGVQVTLNDTLQGNTTYLFQFKNAIADLNEGNKLQSYVYAFSTGDVIDSMVIGGVVLDAFARQPRKDMITVMLYDAAADDSSVVNSSPQYVTRCGEDGTFLFTHIKQGDYRIVAIEDGDKNMRYAANEAIAFVQGVVSSHVAGDTLAQTVEMLMSIDEATVQRITSSSMSREGYAEIATARPMIAPRVECDSDVVWHLSEGGDTLRLWTKSPTVDRMQVVVTDSALNDTLKMQYRKRRNAAPSPTTSSANNWVSLAFKSQLPYFERARLRFSVPIDRERSVVDSVVSVVRLSDSSVTYHSIAIDSAGMTATIDFAPVADESYDMVLIEGRLRNLYGVENGRLKIQHVERQGEEKFGAIIVTITDNDSTMPYVVQLLDDKGAMCATHVLGIGEQKATFRNLRPDSYQVVAFVDRDGNGKWTPGDYWQHRQPEEVYRLGKTLQLRANWDIEERLPVGDKLSE